MWSRILVTLVVRWIDNKLGLERPDKRLVDVVGNETDEARILWLQSWEVQRLLVLWKVHRGKKETPRKNKWCESIRTGLQMRKQITIPKRIGIVFWLITIPRMIMRSQAEMRSISHDSVNCQVQADQGAMKADARNILAYVSTPRPKDNAEMRRTSQFKLVKRKKQGVQGRPSWSKRSVLSIREHYDNERQRRNPPLITFQIGQVRKGIRWMPRR